MCLVSNQIDVLIKEAPHIERKMCFWEIVCVRESFITFFRHLFAFSIKVWYFNKPRKDYVPVIFKANRRFFSIFHGKLVNWIFPVCSSSRDNGWKGTSHASKWRSTKRNVCFSGFCLSFCPIKINIEFPGFDARSRLRETRPGNINSFHFISINFLRNLWD